MPTAARFARNLAILALAGYIAMLALVTFVEPQPREIVTTIPLHSGTHASPQQPVRARTARVKRADRGTRLFMALEGMPFARR